MMNKRREVEYMGKIREKTELGGYRINTCIRKNNHYEEYIVSKSQYGHEYTRHMTVLYYPSEKQYISKLKQNNMKRMRTEQYFAKEMEQIMGYLSKLEEISKQDEYGIVPYYESNVVWNEERNQYVIFIASLSEMYDFKEWYENCVTVQQLLEYPLYAMEGVIWCIQEQSEYVKYMPEHVSYIPGRGLCLGEFEYHILQYMNSLENEVYERIQDDGSESCGQMIKTIMHKCNRQDDMVFYHALYWFYLVHDRQLPSIGWIRDEKLSAKDDGWNQSKQHDRLSIIKQLQQISEEWLRKVYLQCDNILLVEGIHDLQNYCRRLLDKGSVQERNTIYIKEIRTEKNQNIDEILALPEGAKADGKNSSKRCVNIICGLICSVVLISLIKWKNINVNVAVGSDNTNNTTCFTGYTRMVSDNDGSIEESETVYSETIQKNRVWTQNESTQNEVAQKETAQKDSTTKETTTKESTQKEMITKESTTKDSTTKETITKESTTKDSTTKKSTTKESTTKKSTTKESTTRESTPKELDTKENVQRPDETSAITSTENK